MIGPREILVRAKLPGTNQRIVADVLDLDQASFSRFVIDALKRLGAFGDFRMFGDDSANMEWDEYTVREDRVAAYVNPEKERQP